MSFNLKRYFEVKSLKFSDSYEVVFNNENENSFYIAGFTPPKVGFDEDVYNYGNRSRTFLIPKYDSANEVTIEFYENELNDEKHNVFKKFFARGHVGSGYNTSLNYQPYYDFNSLEIRILNNNLDRYVYVYRFKNLKILKYSLYDLDYANEAIAKISITFMFQTYEKGVLNLDTLNASLGTIEEPKDKKPPVQD